MRHANQQTKSMQCPACSSHNTQSNEIAYSQSVRISDSGYRSVSEFGEQIQPPPEKDELVGPLFVAGVVGITSLFFLPDILTTFDVSWHLGLSVFAWPMVALGCVVGWTAGLCISIPRIRYNTLVRPALLEEWMRGVVCRRCGMRFERSDPNVTHDIEETPR